VFASWENSPLVEESSLRIQMHKKRKRRTKKNPSKSRV